MTVSVPSIVRLCAASALLAAPCLGQFVVDPGGGGNFTDLQNAIDTVPTGSVLRVRGGTFGPLTVDKSLSIVGDPQTTITSPNTFQTSVLPSPIRLQGNGSDRLDLANVTIQGTIDGSWYNAGDAGISGTGFAQVRIHDSSIHGATWFQLTGNALGVSAITLPSTTVVLSRCDVRASDSENDAAGGSFTRNGVHAVQADRVIALESTVTGGGCYRTNLIFGPPSPTPCPCYGSGIGGPGIDATDVFDAASVIEGGEGSEVFVSFGGSPATFFAWGRQPNGPPVSPTTVRTQMPTDLFMVDPPRIGRGQAIWFNRSSPEVGALGLGAMATAPIRLGSGLLFLDPLALYTVLPIPPRSLVLNIPIPPVGSLGGAELSMQALWTDGALSNPVTGVITY